MQAIIFSGGLPTNTPGDFDIYLIPYSILAAFGLFFVSRRIFIVVKERMRKRHETGL